MLAKNFTNAWSTSWTKSCKEFFLITKNVNFSSSKQGNFKLHTWTFPTRHVDFANFTREVECFDTSYLCTKHAYITHITSIFCAYETAASVYQVDSKYRLCAFYSASTLFGCKYCKEIGSKTHFFLTFSSNNSFSCDILKFQTNFSMFILINH